MTPPTVRVCALFALALAITPAAHAGAPSPEARERLTAALAHAKSVRVHTPSGPWIEYRIAVDASGVRLPGSTPPGSVELRPSQPSLVPWESVAGIEVRAGRSDRVALGGALVGLVLGAAWELGTRDRGGLDGSSTHGLSLLLGAGLGFGVGSLMAPGLDPWVRVWPEAP